MKIKILPNPELLQEIKSNIPDAVEVIIPFWGDNTCFDIGSDFDSIEAYDENDDDIDLFIKSLAITLRATDCKKIESADIQHGIDQVFTFCAESEQLPSKFEKFKVINFGTIQDICKNKESKVKFLHAIQYSLN